MPLLYRLIRRLQWDLWRQQIGVYEGKNQQREKPNALLLAGSEASQHNRFKTAEARSFGQLSSSQKRGWQHL